MADKQITVVSPDGSFTEVECGDVMKDGYGNTIGGSVNGGIGVPISALSGQSLQLFDKPINIHEVGYAPAGGGQNASTTFGLDLATASAQALPSNAVRAILYVHSEFLHAFFTTGDKESNIWADSYPASGDFTGFDVDNNFVTRTFLASGNKIDTADATLFTAITRTEGSNNIGIKLAMPNDSQTYLIIYLIGYTLNEEGSTFGGKTIIHHRKRLFQSSATVGPSATSDNGLTMPIPTNSCALPTGVTHSWLHHIMRGAFTGSGEGISTPKIGAYPAGGDFGLLDPSWFGRSRTSNAPENFSEVATSTSQMASTAPEIGYRLDVGANNQVNEREVHMSGYLIDDDPASVSGLTYVPANGHFLKTATLVTGVTSATVDLDLKTLLASTPVPASATKAIIRIQVFGERGAGNQDDTIDTHVDAYPSGGNYSGFETVDNKVSLQRITINTTYKLSSGATVFTDLNLTDGTNHVGVKFVKTTNCVADYYIWIEGFLLDETGATTANATTVKFQEGGDLVTAGNTINFAASDFNVTAGGAGIADIALAVSSTAADPVRTVSSANSTIAVGDDKGVVIHSTGAVDRTATLPLASALSGMTVVIKKSDSGIGKVVITAAGADTIDGSATRDVVNQYDAVRLVSDGTNWHII